MRITNHNQRVGGDVTFKIEFTSDEKVKFIQGEKTLAIARTNDGIMCSPDWTTSNRHLTALPSGLNKGRGGDWGLHLTEPKDTDSVVLDDVTYWKDNLLNEVYLFARNLGDPKPATELTNCELVLLDWDEMLDVLENRGVITDDGETAILDFDDLSGVFSEEELLEVAENLLIDVTIEEAYELNAIFAFNKDSGKMVWLFPDGYVTEVQISEFLGVDRDQLRDHPTFGKAVELFDQILED